MDDRRAKRVNEAARKFAETPLGSHEALLERFVESGQERQAQMSQIFFEASQELVQRVRRRREAGRVLVQGSARAYADFLDSIFFYYRENVRASEELKKAANKEKRADGSLS